MEQLGVGKAGDLNRLQLTVDSLIKPRGYPVAFRMFKSESREEDLIKARKYLQESRLALCQIIKAVNVYGNPVLIERDTPQACADGEHVLGFHEHPESLAVNWEVIFGFSRELHDKIVSDIIHVPFKTFNAVLFAPLSAFDDLQLPPDGVIFVVNGIQAELMILNSYLATRNKPGWSYDGYAACEIVAALKNGNSPWLVTPCLGARSFASTQDDEIWLGFSIEMLKATAEAMQKNNMRYPPSVEQGILTPPLRDHIITRMMTRPD